MAEFERVPLRPRPKRDWLPGVIAAVAILIGLAIVKPWDLGRTAAGLGGATPLPTFFVRPTERTGPRPYDPILFGVKEPDPAWELWPAGYVVEFGMSGPVRVHTPGQSDAPATPAPDPTAEPSPAPEASVRPGSTSRPGASGPPAISPPPATPAVDDGFIDLGTAAHLVALGINTPADFHVDEVSLVLLTDAAATPVAIVRLPTYWESTHFIAIAPEDPAVPGQETAWAPGLYRLSLTTQFGQVRSIDLRIREGPTKG